MFVDLFSLLTWRSEYSASKSSSQSTLYLCLEGRSVYDFLFLEFGLTYFFSHVNNCFISIASLLIGLLTFYFWLLENTKIKMYSVSKKLYYFCHGHTSVISLAYPCALLMIFVLPKREYFTHRSY